MIGKLCRLGRYPSFITSAALSIILFSVGSAATDAAPSQATALAKADRLVAKMTLDEKVAFVHGRGLNQPPGAAASVPGVPRLGIPDIIYVDSHAGLNVKGKDATALPDTLALAASWDPSLARAYGVTTAREARALGFTGVIGGGINLAREPRGGRTFEYMGEDPVLAGLMLAARNEGTASEHVLSTAKHFAVNGQETNRFNSNSIVDERTLRELYLLGFEIALKAAPPAEVMCAYNLVNGEKACENHHLLTDILKDEWGFAGFVQSDWVFAVSNTRRAVMAGTDEEEPGAESQKRGLAHFNLDLKTLVLAGEVPQARLDDMVRRKLAALYRFGIMNSPRPEPRPIDVAAGEALALKAAQESIVLLKNDTGPDDTAVLPLRPSRRRRLVVIGGHADAGVISGGGSGDVPARGGSAVACNTPGATDKTTHVFPACATWRPSSPLAALRASLPGVEVSFLDGRDVAQAAQAAAEADAAIVFVTQFSSEQTDLTSLSLPNQADDPANQSYDQNALITAVAARAQRTVVVLENATAVTMPWADSVQGIVATWFPGVKGGEAVADVLTGRINPSGKLPLSFPRSETDLPQLQISTSDRDVRYTEGLEIGYRRYDALGVAPLFPFGHGLSYTRFDYHDLHVRRRPNGDVQVSFQLSNVGDQSGSEVAQIYASLPQAAGEPPQRLIGWRRVTLSPGKTQRLAITIPAARFAIWANGWRVPGGGADIRVGGSSRDPHTIHASLMLYGLELPGGA